MSGSSMFKIVSAIVLMCCMRNVSAHAAPFSYLDVEVESSGLRGSLVIHDFDAAYELGLSAPDALQNEVTARNYREALLKIVSARLQMESDGQVMQPVWGDMQVVTDQQSLRFSFVAGDGTTARLDVTARLFPYDASHQTFVNIYEQQSLTHQSILDAEHPSLTYYRGNLQGKVAVFRNFIPAGIHHILIGPDHILFLLGLLLLGGSLRQLIAIVTAFTVGHSITLSLAATQLLMLPASLIEPAIALSIVVVGVDNLLVQRESMSATETAVARRDLRTWFAALFGLVHGFGFAAVLLELDLPRAALGWSLAAFNIGVEIGQLLIVLVLALLLVRLKRINALFAQRAVLLGSFVVIAAGAYWFVQRIGLLPAWH